MSDSLIVLHTSIAIIAIVLPILVALLLIAFGAIAEAAGLKSPVVTFFGDPVFALFVGLLGAYLLAYVAQRAGRGSDERWLRRDGPDPADHRPRRLVGSGDHRHQIPGYPRRRHAGSANDPVGLVDRRRVAPCHRFDLGRRHHRLEHTGPDNGWSRSSRGNHGPGHRLWGVVRIRGNSNFFWMFQSLLGVSTREPSKRLPS